MSIYTHPAMLKVLKENYLILSKIFCLIISFSGISEYCSVPSDVCIPNFGQHLSYMNKWWRLHSTWNALLPMMVMERGSSWFVNAFLNVIFCLLVAPTATVPNTRWDLVLSKADDRVFSLILVPETGVWGVIRIRLSMLHFEYIVRWWTIEEDLLWESLKHYIKSQTLFLEIHILQKVIIRSWLILYY